MNDVSGSGFWAVVPAAGVGARMGADRPKQYLSLLGQTVIEHTIERLRRHPAVAGVVVAVAAEDPYWPTLSCSGEGTPVHSAPGGVERCHSVLNALHYLGERVDRDDWVLVHDAVRPCLRHGDMDRLIERLRGDPVGGLLALPVSDTVKRADSQGRVRETVDRQGLWRALTPQLFRIGMLAEALSAALAEGYAVTDESSAVEFAGYEPAVVEGEADNIKITHPQDLALAERFLNLQRGDQ